MKPIDDTIQQGEDNVCLDDHDEEEQAPETEAETAQRQKLAVLKNITIQRRLMDSVQQAYQSEMSFSLRPEDKIPIGMVKALSLNRNMLVKNDFSKIEEKKESMSKEMVLQSINLNEYSYNNKYTKKSRETLINR